MAASAELPPRSPCPEPEVAPAPLSPSPLDARASGRLRGRVISLGALSLVQRDTMWRLFATYYEGPGVARACFDADLDAKQDLILLEDTGDRSLRGFCTLAWHHGQTDGVAWRALFTGDTIIDHRYWGQLALHITFTRYLLTRWLRSPSQPVYWYLITKGYKTYLILTRNFPHHFPRHDRDTPPFEAQLIHALSARLFGDWWCPERGLVCVPLDKRQRLRADVAPQHTVIPGRHADVDYFFTRNPGHAEGDELVVLARFDLQFLAHFATRSFKKKRARR